MHDFNHTYLKQRSASEAVTATVDAALRKLGNNGRSYLGASALNGRAFELGSSCLRKIQWLWTDPQPIDPRILRIFSRGHWVEEYALELLREAGFEIGERDEFAALEGAFQGHTDGRVLSSPIPEIETPCLLEIKGLGESGWKKLRKEGLKRSYPSYYDQVALYQGYCNLAEHPALFIAFNCNTMEMESLLIPFDPEAAQKASDMAVHIVTATQAGELLPRVTDNPEHFSCKRCVYRGKCWNAPGS